MDIAPHPPTVGKAFLSGLNFAPAALAAALHCTADQAMTSSGALAS